MGHPDSTFFLISYLLAIVYGVTTMYRLRSIDHTESSEVIVVLCIVLSVVSALSIFTETSVYDLPKNWFKDAHSMIDVAINIGNKWFRLLLTLFTLGYVRNVNGIQAPFLFKGQKPKEK